LRSLNVLSFQTSFETWTTAAIINWKKLLRLSVVSKQEGKEKERLTTDHQPREIIDGRLTCLFLTLSFPTGCG
jgi:hypothetical protein